MVDLHPQNRRSRPRPPGDQGWKSTTPCGVGSRRGATYDGRVAARRTIAHLDMDAFYVAVELLRRPELRGKPVIVAGSGPRAVVTTASYEARPFGVGSAIPVAFAKRRCPDLVHLPVDMAHYRERSREVMGLVAELEVPTQPVSLDETYIDLSSLPDPIARMSSLVRRIREQLRLDASVGIGPEPARRQGRLGRREAARVRRPHPRAGGAPLRARAAAAAAGRRAEDGRAPRRARPQDDRRPAGLSGRRARTALRAEPRPVPARARALPRRLGGRARRDEVAVGGDHLRLRHRRPRAARAGARRAVAPARVRARRALDARAHDRDQGAPRRLDDGHPGAHDRGGDQRPGA